jgi:hypothetical protein
MWTKHGIEVFTSIRVWILTAAFVARNSAHQKTLRHKSIIVASNAYTGPGIASLKSSSVTAYDLAFSIIT